jgi:hypothetical protein
MPETEMFAYKSNETFEVAKMRVSTPAATTAIQA